MARVRQIWSIPTRLRLRLKFSGCTSHLYFQYGRVNIIYRLSGRALTRQNYTCSEGYELFMTVLFGVFHRCNSPQSRCNFGVRVFSNFLAKIMAAIFDFNGSGRLGRGINLNQGGSWRSKINRGVGLGEFRSNCKSNMAGRLNDCELIT